MNEGKVKQCCRAFRNGRTNVHDKERIGRPSIQTDEIVFQGDHKLRSDRRLTISALADEFPLLGRTIALQLSPLSTGLNLRRRASMK